MALQKQILRNKLEDIMYEAALKAFKEAMDVKLSGSPNSFSQKQAEKFAEVFRNESANDMANAIDAFVRTGQVNLTSGTIA